MSDTDVAEAEEVKKFASKLKVLVCEECNRIFAIDKTLKKKVVVCPYCKGGVGV